MGRLARQDTFTTLAGAADAPGVGARIVAATKQVIDGVNHLDYWMGKPGLSNRNHIFHYCESKLSAVRMGSRNFHVSMKKDYSANVIPCTVPKYRATHRIS